MKTKHKSYATWFVLLFYMGLFMTFWSKMIFYIEKYFNIMKNTIFYNNDNKIGIYSIWSGSFATSNDPKSFKKKIKFTKISFLFANKSKLDSIYVC